VRCETVAYPHVEVEPWIALDLEIMVKDIVAGYRRRGRAVVAVTKKVLHEVLAFAFLDVEVSTTKSKIASLTKSISRLSPQFMKLPLK
jgi:hypothetical protein